MPTDSLAPRPELLALLDAVKDNPDDDTPRLVLADWLDEQDNPLDAERAAFIRKNIADFHSRSGSYFRTDEGDALAQRWLGPILSLGPANFARGLPLLYIEGPRLLKSDTPALLTSEAFAFVQFVELTAAGGTRMEAIAKLPELRFIPGLSLNPFNSLGVHYATKFFESPNLTGLRHISFRGIDPGAAGIQALAANPALSRLRKLWLFHNKLVDKAVAALATAKHLTNLTHLDLHDNNIGDKGAAALATSKLFPKLSVLDMRENPRLTADGKKLLRDTFGDRVKLD